MKLDRILVAVDGSDNSLTAVDWVAGLAGATGAEVIAVHALGLLEPTGSGGSTPAQGQRQTVQHELDTTWCAPLAAAGVRTRHLLRDGNPVTVVLAVADEEDADLIVLGSRGLGGYPELLLGSTSTQVAQRSSRPVTIVPS